ncbi:MAG: response regulator [Candidatus Binatia bacterium]
MRRAIDVPSLLLIEDDPDDIELTCRALKRAGLGNPIDIAVDGQAALDTLYCGAMTASAQIGLILLDLGLPKVQGWDVLQRVLQDKRTRHIPVVVLTGSLDEEDRVRSYKAGAAAFLRKPIRVDDLIRLVGEIHGYQLLVTRLESMN